MTSSVAEDGRGESPATDQRKHGRGQVGAVHAVPGAGIAGVPAQAPPPSNSPPAQQAPIPVTEPHAAPVTSPPRASPSAPGFPALPPGQRISPAWPVRHYGPVPSFRPERWDLRVCGATASGRDHRWDWAELSALPRISVTADMHCVTKFTVPGLVWEGVAASELLRLAPPAPQATHVMVWADYGYSANLPIGDLIDEHTLLASHGDGTELTPEHGYPVRLVVPHRYGWKSVKWVRILEYLTSDRRGFWEERGYHNTADPWREQRFSYLEMPGEGPPL